MPHYLYLNGFAYCYFFVYCECLSVDRIDETSSAFVFVSDVYFMSEE